MQCGLWKVFFMNASTMNDKKLSLKIDNSKVSFICNLLSTLRKNNNFHFILSFEFVI